MYAIHKRTKFQLRKVIFVTAALLLIFYCIYQTIQGDRGLAALFQLSKKHKLLTEELEKLRMERATIENKVGALKSESLDTDLLDEQARRVLGYAHEDETVIVESDEEVQE